MRILINSGRGFFFVQTIYLGIYDKTGNTRRR